MDKIRSDWRIILKQGALLLLFLLIMFISSYYLIYQISWGSSPHWIEGHRDRYKINNLLENIRWFWIHEDTQYWIVRLRFDQGPVILDGIPPDARYWSVTYYAGNEENPSVNSQDIKLNDDGTYQITFTQNPDDGTANHILVRQGVKRGIIELRITLQDISQPVILPSVSQNDLVIIKGGPR